MTERYEFRLDSLQVSNEGLAPFYWPIARDEVASFGRDAVRDLHEALAGADELASGHGPMDLLIVPFAVEAMAVFQAAALLQRSDESGIAIVPDEASRFVAGLKSGSLPGPRLPTALRAGLKPEATWRRPLSRVRGALRRDGLRYLRRRPVGSGEQVVAAAIGPLISAHAKQMNEPVEYRRIHDWYGPLPSRWAGTVSADLVDQALEIVYRQFERREVLLPTGAEAHLQNWIRETVGSAQARLSALNGSDLPPRLWIGTAGIIWTRLLAHAVRQAGGEVTAHDHGISAGFSPAWHAAANELVPVDRYVTYTPKTASLLEEASAHPYLRGRVPQVTWVDPVKRKPARHRSSGTREGQLLYVATLCTIDIANLLPVLAAPVYLDWQARLLSWLSGRGFKVWLRSHPEGPIPSATGLHGLAEGEAIGPFQRVVERFDHVLFDHPLTTTIAETMRTDAKMTLVDFGLVSLPPGGLELFSDRMSIARAWSDGENRVQVDWDELAVALDDAAELRYSTAAETLFGQWL